MKPNKQKTDWEELWDWCCTEVYRLDNGKDIWKQINKVHQFALQQQREEIIKEIEGIEELRLEDYVSDIEPKLTIDNLNNLNMIIKSQAKNELRKEIRERLKQITNLKEK